MNELQYFVVHSAATKNTYNLHPDDIDNWHRGKRFDALKNLWRFNGNWYKNLNDLNGVNLKCSSGTIIPARETNGHGWGKVGYYKMIKFNGEVHEFVEINHDQWIESREMTNGALGFNHNSVHIVLEGGWDARENDPFESHFTDAQWLVLQNEIKQFIARHPQIKVVGHNQLTSRKACPGFWVPKYMTMIELRNYTINAKLI